MRDDLEEACRDLYARTRVFFGSCLPRPFYGYKILNSPPRLNPQIFFIGYQPSGRREDWKREWAKRSHLRWPSNIEYLTAEGKDWRLAPIMQGIFGERLAHSVGTNAIWLRSPSKSDYKKLDKSLRQRVEGYSADGVRELMALMKPKIAVSIGFDALRMLGTGVTDDLISDKIQRSGKKRTLTQAGMIGVTPAIACLHLTGARISTGDRRAIRSRLLSFVDSKM